ncbi:MAG: hypothetical protein ACRD4O_10355 [Bryobacteraceae bacterium]
MTHPEKQIWQWSCSVCRQSGQFLIAFDEPWIVAEQYSAPQQAALHHAEASPACPANDGTGITIQILGDVPSTEPPIVPYTPIYRP